MTDVPVNAGTDTVTVPAIVEQARAITDPINHRDLIEQLNTAFDEPWSITRRWRVIDYTDARKGAQPAPAGQFARICAANDYRAASRYVMLHYVTSKDIEEIERADADRVLAAVLPHNVSFHPRDYARRWYARHTTVKHGVTVALEDDLFNKFLNARITRFCCEVLECKFTEITRFLTTVYINDTTIEHEHTHAIGYGFDCKQEPLKQY